MSQKKTLLKYTKYVMWGTVALIPPAAFFYLLEFYTHNPFAEVRPWAQLFNIVLFELLAGIFLCVRHAAITPWRCRGAGIRACQCLCGAFPHQPAGTVGHSVLEDGGKCVRQL